MPYTIREESGQYCLYKSGEEKALGCHDTKAECEAQMAALYANEKAGRESLFIQPVDTGREVVGDHDTNGVYLGVYKEGERPEWAAPPPAGETDEDTKEVETPAENVGVSVLEEETPAPDETPTEDAPEETTKEATWQDIAVGLATADATDEQSDPSFWEQPSAQPVEAAKTDIHTEVARLVDEKLKELLANTGSTTLTSGTSTAVTVAFPEASTKSVSLIPDAFERGKVWLAQKFKPKRLETGLKVVGDHWLIVHSNNFEDRDKEIFTERAIQKQVARFDLGIVPLPKLWVWHEGKAFEIGQAEVVAYHDHFTISAGKFDPTPQGQKARDYYAKNAHKTRVSHGYAFPPEAFDGKHYHEFNTFEISLLPRGVEANLFTSLEGVKAMALSEKKRAYLEEVFGKEYVAAKLEELSERGKALEELGVAYKDFSDATPETKGVESEAVKALTADAIEASGLAVEMSLALSKKFEAMQTEWKAMQEDYAGRPRKASEASETELTPDNIGDRMEAIQKNIEKQATEIDKFWNLPVTKLGV